MMRRVGDVQVYEKDSPPSMAVLTAHGGSWFGLRYLTDEVRHAVVMSGLVLKSKERYVLVFSPDGTADAADNQACAHVVRSLAEAGVQFANGYKQTWSPWAIASDMRSKGFEVGPAREIGFNGVRWISRALGDQGTR